MATDAWGQTIPSWVEDNSYECSTRQTIEQNDGHPVTMSAEKFREFMVTAHNGYIVRDGKVKDNNSWDGKFMEDTQRTFTNPDSIAQKEKLIEQYGADPDGNPRATLSLVAGVDENDTSNWGPAQWIGNSGLDAYFSPYKFYNGSTEVAKTDVFDSVKVDIYWRYIDDYRKAITGEINPMSTVTKRSVGQDWRDTPSEGQIDHSTGKDISPSNEHVSIEDFGRGEDYKFKSTCTNDFIVSGASCKYKKEWTKGGDHETASTIDNYLIANGMGRTANVNTWVTHTSETLGQPRTTKNVLNFVGGQRVKTTLQDIDSGVFSLPNGHPAIEHTPTADVNWKDFWQEADDAGLFSAENKAAFESAKDDLY